MCCGTDVPPTTGWTRPAPRASSQTSTLTPICHWRASHYTDAGHQQRPVAAPCSLAGGAHDLAGGAHSLAGGAYSLAGGAHSLAGGAPGRPGRAARDDRREPAG